MSSSKKILIIGDFPPDLECFRVLLEERDKSIITAISGEEGVKIARSEDISLILLAIQAPGMSGMDTCQKIMRLAQPPVPLILVSGQNISKECIQEGFTLGVTDIIDRHLDPLLLSSKVNFFLKFYQQKEEGDQLNRKLKTRLAERSGELYSLKNAIEHCAEQVIVTNVNGEIEYVNPSFVMSTGYEKEEVMGKNVSILKSGKHEQEFFRSMWETILGGMVWQGEIINTKKSGELSFEYMTISPVYNSGRLTNFVAVQQDIGKEKIFHERMAQTEKLSAIGTFVSGLVHEINNPITAIMGYSDMLLRKKGVPDDIIDELNIILEQAKRSSSLVKNLLNFSRVSRVSRMLLDVNKIVNESVGLYTTRFQLDNIQLITEYCEGVSYVYGDKNRLQQVFVNIINNGRYALTASRPERRGSVFKVRTYACGKRVKISFENDGPKIPEKSLERIFEPFFTSKDVGHGTGLGLSVSSEILKEQGGRIKAENIDNVNNENGKRGVRFEIELPVSSGEGVK